MNELRLRPAGPGDLALLRRWDAEPHVIAAKGDEDWQWERELAHRPAWREQLMAELDGRPIGFVEIIDPRVEDSHYWGEVPAGLRAIDIWIGEVDCLGRGFGTRMMRLAIERCFAEAGVWAILIDPLAGNRAALRFYRRLGFRLWEMRRFGEDLCAIHRLARADYPPAAHLGR